MILVYGKEVEFYLPNGLATIVTKQKQLKAQPLSDELDEIEEQEIYKKQFREIDKKQKESDEFLKMFSQNKYGDYTNKNHKKVRNWDIMAGAVLFTFYAHLSKKNKELKDSKLQQKEEQDLLSYK